MKELFHITIDEDKFRSTNYIWNKLKLNSPYNVGYVTTLIQSETFTKKEEWRDYYYQSGEKRLEKLKKLNLSEKDINQLRWQQLAGSHGRTEYELKEIGKQLYQAVEKKGNPLKISLPECVWMVKHRVIGETWNGIVIREYNTILNLEKEFPNLTFQTCDGERDYKYAIDYEVYDGEKLITALQIKPESYKNGRSKAILKAKKGNELKNKEYEDKYNKPVLYVYANTKGEITNDIVKITLSELINKERESAS